MTDQQSTPLWVVMRDALISETGAISVDSTARLFIELPFDGDWIAAQIEALAYVIVPEERRPTVDPGSPYWVNERLIGQWEGRAAIRQRLLNEARRAREAGK